MSISNVDIILLTEICFSHMGEQEELYYKDKPTAKEKENVHFGFKFQICLPFILSTPAEWMFSTSYLYYEAFLSYDLVYNLYNPYIGC